MSRAGLYIELARPFTLVAPALGMVSGGVMGWGAMGRPASESFPWASVATGAVVAVVLNAASNALNQVFDVEVDAVNKPGRPLPSGRLTMREAGWFSAILYVCALTLGGLINVQCFALVSAAALFTVGYSVPPVRTKRFWPLANLTIALPRGVFLVAAGWSTAADVARLEPWYISLSFGGFLLGAASTKDFADVSGDRAGGCRTLPVAYGPRTAALIITPSLVLPFLLLPLGVKIGLLTGHPVILAWTGWLLALWGVYVAYVMIRSPEGLATARNHVSWIHMYLMMVLAQVSLILAYTR